MPRSCYDESPPSVAGLVGTLFALAAIIVVGVWKCNSDQPMPSHRVPDPCHEACAARGMIVKYCYGDKVQCIPGVEVSLVDGGSQ